MADWTLLAGGTVRLDSTHEDGLRRLRETLGNILQVRNLALLLGAGASFHLGLPAIRRVSLDAVREMFTAANESLEKDEEPLLSSLLEGEDGNLEDVLASLSSSLSFAQSWKLEEVAGRDSSLSVKVVGALRAKLNFVLAKACELPARIPSDSAHFANPWEVHQSFFRKVLYARRGELPRIKVFTTNYDVAIESALDESSVPFFDGFVGSLHRQMRLESYGLDLYFSSEEGERRLIKVPRALQLYKIHGSLNWAARTSSRGTQLVVQTGETPSRDDLALIYPTPYKESDTLGYPYADLLRIFSTSVSASQSALIVVGYSFADEHVNRLIYQALRANPSFSLFVVNPSGILLEDGDSNDLGRQPTLTDSRLGRLTELEDPRIMVLTGSEATFEKLALTMLPDPAGMEDEGLQDEQVKRALLAPIEPSAP